MHLQCRRPSWISGSGISAGERISTHSSFLGLPRWLNLQCRRPRFPPWVGKIPCRTEWLHTPVFWSGEFQTEKNLAGYSPVQFSSETQWCATLCNCMDCCMPGLNVHHQLPEITQTHVHWLSDAIQLSHSLLSPSPPAINLSQHQGFFKWVSSSHQVAKVLEFQLQHQSFQWLFKTDFL